MYLSETDFIPLVNKQSHHVHFVENNGQHERISKNKRKVWYSINNGSEIKNQNKILDQN